MLQYSICVILSLLLILLFCLFALFFSAEASPAECCQHAKILEDTQFVDGYKQLGFQETAYGEFLSRLRENPRLIASSLVAGEKLNQENTQSVIYTVFTIS